ncbi:uncharacterized protein EAF02_001082 [Botrytis sinoallii]|uniref:uncharacterized protein n=1 Tax=Botrytis sinoallii TaxID=1463999 RepID=UPI0018FFA448|nr:uncharacterized protein EAF02_001082 [Botrytis sinoallii]KAF7893544.1 hypothetical protein EAF02_001082 [Botrytis sinoallii]
MGNALVEHGNKLADKKGLPIFMQASPFGFPFHTKHGFETVQCLDVDFREWAPNAKGNDKGYGNYKFRYMQRRPRTLPDDPDFTNTLLAPGVVLLCLKRATHPILRDTARQGSLRAPVNVFPTCAANGMGFSCSSLVLPDRGDDNTILESVCASCNTATMSAFALAHVVLLQEVSFLIGRDLKEDKDLRNLVNAAIKRAVPDPDKYWVVTFWQLKAVLNMATRIVKNWGKLETVILKDNE